MIPLVPLLAVVSVCAVAGPTASTQAAGGDLARVLKTLGERQGRIRSVRFTATIKTRYTNIYWQRTYGALLQRLGRDLPGDKVAQTQFTLVLHGSKIRYDVKTRNWSVRQSRFVDYERTYACVGDVEWLHFRTTKEGMVSHFTTTTRILPTILAYQLLDPSRGPAEPDRIALKGRAKLAGHPCIVLEIGPRPRSARGIRQRLWVATDRGSSVIQSEIRDRRGALVRHIRLAYEPDDRIGWRLKSWTQSSFRDGGLKYLESATVAKTVANGPVNPNEFKIVFPPGTRVHDRIAGTQFTVKQAQRQDKKSPDGRQQSERP